jgi:epsin
MQHFGKGALRVAKNYTKGYSDTQAKVRDATSNDPWGPSGTQMNELAQMSYNQGDFVEIMEMLDKRLNDKGKNWRHVFKSLTVLDYLLHAGSENVVIYFKDNIYIIKTLKEFQYVDEEGKDQGANVRQKAKDITNLLQDESRLREERRTRASMRDRMIRGRGDGEDGDYTPPNGQPPAPSFSKRGRGKDRDEEDLRKAIEESKKSLAAEQAKLGGQSNEDKELQQAIKLSEEEERKRAKALEDANANSLFDDQQQLPHPQSNNPFPLDPTPYAVGLQPQYTQMQPQFTSFNPYQNQAEQEAAQAEFFRQQQLWQQQQQAEMLRQQQEAEAYQQQLLMQQQQQEQMYQQQMQQQQWYLQQQQMQQQQQQPLQPQATGFGTKNPFAPSPSFSNTPPPLPQSSQPQFNLQGTYANSTPSNSLSSPSTLSPSSTPHNDSQSSGFRTNSAMQKKNEQNAALNDLFANRDDGMDTFGNTGVLRYGHTEAARVLPYQQTGNNPFGMQHQPHQQQQQQVQNERPFFDI